MPERIETMTPMLAADFPPAAFTDESRKMVAAGCTSFPGYGVIRTALENWLSDQTRRSGNIVGTITPYMLEKIMESCNGEPGSKLASWLNYKGIYPDNRGVWPGTARMATERADAVRDWSDPAKVQTALRSLAGHPMEGYLRRMLHGLVQKHAPQNLGLFDSPAPVAVAFPALPAPEIGHSMFGED